jgi:O-acetylhomoserine/O-acetylserine sulfhydrylase-like pyridoxal-dependent enzyme
MSLNNSEAVTVRFAVGIEAAEDIIVNITRALDKI